MKLHGIHHITAITSDAQKNIDFYSGLLGMRQVKTTVNFDDPQSYHLYYGDELGRPGSALTFFAWPGAPRGTVGTSQVMVTSFSVPEGSLPYWIKRLGDAKVMTHHTLGSNVISFTDFDGMRLELVERSDHGEFKPWTKSEVPTKYAIHGFFGATLSAMRMPQTKKLLTEVLGGEGIAEQAESLVFNDDPAKAVITLDAGTAAQGRMGAGVVHHIAFRVPNDEEHKAWHELLGERGYLTSDLVDRSYFHSLYFREPGGVLFEFATDKPGFGIDEPVESLGQSLRLPPWMEGKREFIAKGLPKITVAGSHVIP